LGPPTAAPTRFWLAPADARQPLAQRRRVRTARLADRGARRSARPARPCARAARRRLRARARRRPLAGRTRPHPHAARSPAFVTPRPRLTCRHRAFAMDIEAFYDEATSTLTYVVYDPASRDAVVIDPVLDYDPAGS